MKENIVKNTNKPIMPNPFDTGHNNPVVKTGSTMGSKYFEKIMKQVIEGTSTDSKK
jgi:hypothetical protein